VKARSGFLTGVELDFWLGVHVEYRLVTALRQVALATFTEDRGHCLIEWLVLFFLLLGRYENALPVSGGKTSEGLVQQARPMCA